MKVVYKPTGQLGDIPDNKFDPNLFALPSQPTPTPEQPQSVLQGNLSGNDLFTNDNILSAIANNIARPFLKTGQNIAGAVTELGGLAKQAVGAKGVYQKNENPFLSDATLQDFSSSKGITDQVKNSAAVASWGVPFGKAGFVGSKALVPGAIVGGAQSLPDAQNAEDVAKGIGLGALTAGAGQVIGKATNLIGKGFTKGAEAIAGKVTNDIFKPVVAASPQYVDDVSALGRTANKYGLMNGTSEEGLQKLSQVSKDIGEQVQNGVNAVKTPIDLTKDPLTMLNESIDKNTGYISNDPSWVQYKKYATDRLLNLGGGGESTIVGADGLPVIKSAVTKLSDIYKLKSDIAGELAPVWKQMSRGDYNLNPKEEMNMALWDSLKNVIDKYAPDIRGLNNDQHNMFDIAKAFVKDANKGGKSPSAFTNIFGTMVGNMVGGTPGAIGAEGLVQALGSSGGRKLTGNILSGAGNIMRSNAGVTGAVTKGSMAGLLPAMTPGSTSPDNTQDQTNYESPHTLPSVAQNDSQSQPMSQENYISALRKDALLTGGKNKDIIDTIYAAGAKPDLRTTAKNTLDLVDKMETHFKNMNQIERFTPGSGLNPKKAQLEAETTALAQQISRVTDGRVSIPEIMLQFKYMLPTSTDSNKSAHLKMQSLKNFIYAQSGLQQPNNPNGYLPTYPGQVNIGQ